MIPVTTQSTLACPHCGARSTHTMPTNACAWFHECVGCGALLEPKPGDCCVFCSYGDVRCPPRQADQDCCGSRAASV
ncbi:MAG TPA: GDCCVxC domain-containing (seleno)protein [Xanthomonadaceae bacterium]|nr:GDCCVxC domain-containing (seleno)protein [Xanthomonadaceae bacterium]